MFEVGIPFSYDNLKIETPSFYLSFIVRVFVIQGEFGHDIKITKEKFSKELKKLGWNRKRISQTWNYGKEGVYIKKINKDFLILQGKEKIMSEKGFLTKVESDIEVGFYKFQAFVTEMYTLRPVTQKEEFIATYKFKKKSTSYNNEIFKRSLETKIGRGQRKIASQSGCSLKTVNNRLKKSKAVKTLKRYDNYNGFRINKTNLYFSNENRVFLRYNNKTNSTKVSKTTLFGDQSSLITKKAIFLNGSLGLNKSDDTIYNLVSLI